MLEGLKSIYDFLDPTNDRLGFCLTQKKFGRKIRISKKEKKIKDE